MQMQTHDAGDTAAQPWIVRPHGDLTPLADGVWTVTGSIHVPIGEFPRRMTLVRLDDGRLVVYSAIALDDARTREMEALGTPAFLVVPNDHHREDAMAWKQRYPAMQVVAPAGARERIAAKVPVDTTDPVFGDPAVQAVLVRGTREHELALVVRRAAGTTLVVNDVIANLRRSGGLRGWLLKITGFAGDAPSVPGPVKAMMVRDEAALRGQLLEWAALADLRHIVVSHGEVIDRDPQAVLRTLAESLAGAGGTA